MKKLSYAVIVFATLAISTCSSSSTTRQVLKFGSTVQDYVMFRPNMGYFTSQFSLCSWVKKLRTNNWPYWFYYSTPPSRDEINITDNGYSGMFFIYYFNKINQLDITPGTWYHYCMCWSYSSRIADIYHNGRKIGSLTTPSRRLYTGGTLALGQSQIIAGMINSGSNGNTFGGELFKLNIFSKKFTAAEVKSMYQAGMCSEAEKIHGSYRRLTWESILQQRRYGNVQLVDLFASCVLDNKLAVTQRELEEVEGRLDNKETELQEIKSDLTETQTGLETTQSELQKVKSDLERELGTVKEQLNRKVTEISEMRQRAALTTERLNQTQSELNKTKADLKVTQSDLTQTQTELNKTKADLGVTQSDLTKTHTEFNATRADLEQRLNITQSELRKTQADLGVTKSDLTQTQTELNKTKADQWVTQRDLLRAQTEFNKTKADLEQRLNQTQTEFKSTKADLEQRLNKTQSALKEYKAESELYKIRISETEISSANMSRELQRTKNELILTKTELNLTKDDVAEIGTNLLETRKNLEASLNETRTDLDEMLEKQFNQNKKRQEKTTQELDMLRLQLEKTKNRLNQTLAGLEEQLSDIPDCEVAAANVSRELAATKLELDKKDEELERLRGGMSGEDCLGETSCSHWDILYNHCYFNNVLTEEKFMSLNKVWEKLGKKYGNEITEKLLTYYFL